MEAKINLQPVCELSVLTESLNSGEFCSQATLEVTIINLILLMYLTVAYVTNDGIEERRGYVG